MHGFNRVRTALFLTICLFGGASAAMANGTLKGTIVKDGKPVAGVIVLVNETKSTTISSGKGEFDLKLPAGTYTVIFSLGNNVLTKTGVFVEDNDTTELELEVDWEIGVVESVTVTAAARAAKIVDAPAAVTSVTEEEIEEQASTGQVPKILEFTPGAEVTQSGLYDFNFNTRGFNSSLNRRVSTYIDGRDAGVVLLGAQEWAAVSGGLDDIASLEFIRGPSAALYGANASSGVINITSKAPRDSIGSLLRATGGELESHGMDFRRAAEIGNGWYYKVLAGFKRSGDFAVGRNEDVVDQPEYSEFCMLIGETDCLPAEKSLFRDQDNDINYGSLRFDKYLTDDKLLTFEAGISNIKGPLFQTGIGRVQTIEAERPYYRVAYSAPRWNFLAHYAGRKGDQVNLTRDLIVNFELISDTVRYGFEGQANWNFFDEKLRLVVGVAHTEESVDTVNPATGGQTVVYEPIETDRQAVFSQLDYKVNDRFKLVFAGRVDQNTLHDTQFSPKAAAVYSFNARNSVRMTYNEAFQVANYSEFFLHTRISAFPMGGFVRTICEGPLLPQPVDCGIDGDFVDILAVGNDDLELEKTKAWEVGYSGLYSDKVFLTVDYYRSKNKDFITDLVPQVGTILGDLEGCVDSAGNPQTDVTKCPINSDYLPWVGPDDAENTILFGTLTVAQALRNAVDNSVGGNSLGFRLARDLDGDTVVIARTYSNIGEVETQGVDFGLQYFIAKWLKLQLSFSWFDFEILDSDPRINEILLPNTPEYKGSAMLTFNRKDWSASAGARWVEGFRWSAGVFQGDVDDYTTVDLSGSYQIVDGVSVGINIANALDEKLRQTFGGDFLERRALVNVTARW